MSFWRSFPATRLVNTAFRLIYAGAHKIFSVFRKRAPLTEIIEEPQNVSQEAGQNNSTEILPYEGTISELEQKQKQTTTMENLPGDLLLNIFIRLLAKQLAQMRCVSKSWNALLSQSSFVKSHLHHSINNNDRIILVFYDNTVSSSGPKLVTAHPYQSPHLELPNFIKFPVDDGDTEKIRVIGSVHGLICYFDDNNAIHIWNPSLSAVSTLPPYHVSSHGGYAISFQFGFDPKADDYKVVKLIRFTGSRSLTYI